MKRHTAVFILIASLASFSLPAQSARPDALDTRKSQQELEIMRGIIATTLDFAAREAQGGPEEKSTTPKVKMKRGMWWGGHDVDAYYFYGQGATFIVPVTGLRMGMYVDMGDLELEIADVEEQAAALASGAALTARRARTVPPPPPVPPAPAAAPAPPQPPQPAIAATPSPAPEPRAVREETRKRLREAQEQVKRRRETSQERQKQLQEMVEQAKGYLMEAVANHGDSLTFLKPNEYINVVISTDGADLLGQSGGGHQILSVQKSTIADYKAGRITLEAFKQKMLQY